MPSFYTITNTVAQAQDVNQLIAALRGDAGQGIPISLTALNDSTNFALALKNADPTNSRAFQVLRSNNNVLLQVDANGVIVSPDGSAANAQVVNISLAQTLTNKTLTSPHVTTPVVDSGGLNVAAGNLGIGVPPASFAGVYIIGSSVTGQGGSNNAYGVNAQPTLPSVATNESTAVFAQVFTAAAAVTYAQVAGFHAASPSRGAGSLITAAYGLLVDPINGGGTNSYGLYVGIPTGGSGDNGNVIQGDTAIAGSYGSVLATTATSGFLYIPTCAGTPTGVPLRNGVGLGVGHVALIFDVTGNKLWMYQTGWKGVAVA